MHRSKNHRSNKHRSNNFFKIKLNFGPITSSLLLIGATSIIGFYTGKAINKSFSRIKE